MRAGTRGRPDGARRAPPRSTSRPCRRNRITLESSSACSTSLAGAKGRKSLILVSEGFIYDPNLDEFKTRDQASRRANAAIYFLDTRGLDGHARLHDGGVRAGHRPEQDIGSAFAETLRGGGGLGVAGLATAAASSSSNTNDLDQGHPAHRRRDARLLPARLQRRRTPRATASFRKIQVKVARRRASSVRARKGYYAPVRHRQDGARDEEGRSTPQSRARSTRRTTIDGIPLRMTAYVGDETLARQGQRCWSPTEVDIRELRTSRRRTAASWTTCEFLLVVAHRETRRVLPLRPEDRDEAAAGDARAPATASGSRSCATSSWRRGGYQAKIVVRDKNSRRVGTVIHEFEVPSSARSASRPRSSATRCRPERRAAEGLPGGRLVALARRDVRDRRRRLFVPVRGLRGDKDEAKTGHAQA